MSTDCNHDAPHNTACSKCGMWLMDDGWIACETDLNPTPHERVLAIVEGDVVIASYSGPHRSAIDGRMRPLWSTSPQQPTHWRPLPAPPAGETKA